MKSNIVPVGRIIVLLDFGLAWGLRVLHLPLYDINIFFDGQRRSQWGCLIALPPPLCQKAIPQPKFKKEERGQLSEICCT